MSTHATPPSANQPERPDYDELYGRHSLHHSYPLRPEDPDSILHVQRVIREARERLDARLRELEELLLRRLR